LVRLGEHDIQDDSETRIQDIPILKTIVHESFKPSTFLADIVIFLLDKEAEIAVETVFPICLPIRSDVRNRRLSGAKVATAGWGETSVPG
jgi:hypothetical protein